MKKKLLVGVSSLVSLQFFSMFSEYFFSISALYVRVYNIVMLFLKTSQRNWFNHSWFVDLSLFWPVFP